MRRLAPLEPSIQVVGQRLVLRDTRLGRASGQMWRQDDLLHRAQPVWHDGLRFQHIQGGAGDDARAKASISASVSTTVPRDTLTRKPAGPSARSTGAFTK